MRWIEGVGLFAFLLNVAGNWMLTSRREGGWFVRIGCNVVQFAYAALIESPSLALSALTFGVINCVGIVKWRRVAGHDTGCGVVTGKPCNCGRFA